MDKIETLLYVGNKKVKQLRDERQEILAILNKNQVLPNKYRWLVEKVFSTEYINDYINTKSERCKAGYLPYLDLQVDKEVVDYVASHSIVDSFDYTKPMSEDRFHNVYCDMVGQLNYHLSKIEFELEEEIKAFYKLKARIILNNPEHFKPVGFHTIRELHWTDEDGYTRCDRSINAILFQGQKHQFHILDSEYGGKGVIGLKDLGWLNEQISSDIKIDSEYNTLTLGEIMRVLGGLA